MVSKGIATLIYMQFDDNCFNTICKKLQIRKTFVVSCDMNLLKNVFLVGWIFHGTYMVNPFKYTIVIKKNY